MLGDVAKAGGWFGRAQRLLEREEKNCPERGYLLLPRALRMKRLASTRSSLRLQAKRPRSEREPETAICSRSGRTFRPLR